MADKKKMPYDLKDSFSDNYVVDDNGCWVWKHNKNPGGYGKMVACGEQLAHRVYYRWAHGPIPAGLVVDHMCKNRACVNPDHLRAATYSQNAPYPQQCVRGHDLYGDQVRISNGRRNCLMCQKIRNAENYKKYLADPRRYYRALCCKTPEEAEAKAAARLKDGR